MRPTALGFRSPKERTPAGYYPQVTFDGRALSVAPKRKQPALPQSRRFTQYEAEARKTGCRVGPGVYESVQQDRVLGTPVYREFHGNKDFTNNGHFFAGEHLVFEAAFVPRRHTAARTPATSAPREEAPTPWFLKHWHRGGVT